MHFMKISLCLYIYSTFFDTSLQHLLPEDSVTDNEEQLNREKRDNFIDSILKTIPFFNAEPSVGPETSDDLIDPNDIESVQDVKPIDSSISMTPTESIVQPRSFIKHQSKKVSISSSSIVSASSSALIFLPTTLSMTPSKIYFSVTPALTITKSSKIPLISAVSTKPTLSSLNSSEILKTSSMKGLTLFFSKTSSNTNNKFTSLIHPTMLAKSRITPKASISRTTSSKLIQSGASSINQVDENVIKMMIVPAEGGQLPNEKGYGDSLVTNKETISIPDMKNIRYLYRNVLVPVMSGILGALLITFAIVMYKCLRRRKLQKLRYYGGKPNSGLYRLDQVSLLSDDSSDEE